MPHLIRAEALLLLLLLPLAWWLARAASQSLRRAWASVVDGHLLELQWQGASGSRGHSTGLSVCALLALLALALSGPAFQRIELPSYSRGQITVYVLELAPTMLAQDLKPDRLSRARYKLLDLLEASDEGYTGLVVYAGDAFAVAPVTSDSATLSHLVERLSPDLLPVDGERPALGLALAAQLITSAGGARGRIVLIADSADDEARERAAELRAAGHRIDVLAVGTNDSAPVPTADGSFLKDETGRILLPRLQRDALAAVAAAGGGELVMLEAGRGDVERLRRVSAPGHELREAGNRRLDAWQDLGAWLLLPALPLAFWLALRIQHASAVSLALLVLTAATAMPGRAASPFANQAQREHQALVDGNAELARDSADPERAGSALYQLGDYRAAAQRFARADSARAHYNRGTALARAGDYEQAIAAFDQALALEPDHADALANRESVQRYLEQQPPKQQQQQQQTGENADSQSGEQSQQQQQSADDAESQSPSDGNPQGATDPPPPSEPAPADGAQDQGEGQAQDSPPAAEDAEMAEQQAADRDRLRRALDEAAAQRQADKHTEGEPEKPDQAPFSAFADLDPEQQQEVETLLRAVPDDPSGLLRRKFQRDLIRRQQANDQ